MTEEIIIPLFALTALFVIPAMIGLVAVIMYFKSRNRLYETIEDAVENGASPEVINQLVAMTKSRENEKEEKKGVIKHLSEGVPMLALGLGFIAHFYKGGPTGVIFPGVFLAVFGLGKLAIAAYVAKRDKTDSE